MKQLYTSCLGYCKHATHFSTVSSGLSLTDASCLVQNEQSNEYSPTYTLVYQWEPRETLTIAWINSGKKNKDRLAMRGLRPVLLRELDSIVGFFGRVKEVNGLKRPTGRQKQDQQITDNRKWTKAAKTKGSKMEDVVNKKARK